MFIIISKVYEQINTRVAMLTKSYRSTVNGSHEDGKEEKKHQGQATTVVTCK